MNTVDKYQESNFLVKIYYDEYPDDPNEWNGYHLFLGEVASNRYSLGKSGWDTGEAHRYLPFGEGPWDFDSTDRTVDTEEELREQWEDERVASDEDFYEVFPVRVIDFGGGNTELRFCDHDNAEGYIFVLVPWKSDEKLVEFAASIDPDFIPPWDRANEFLGVWNQYLTGDVYRVEICSVDGEIIESASDVYGLDEAKEWATDMTRSYKDEAETVQFVVIRSDMTTSIVSLSVPLWVGSKHDAWLESHPLSSDKDVLMIVKYNPIQHKSEVSNG